MWELKPNSIGIGLRSEHIPTLLNPPVHHDIDILELTIDNWMNIGGVKKEYLADISRNYPLIAHGLSLSIGDISPLNERYLNDIRHFLDEYHISIYSDHLCFSRDKQGYFYDLLPIPYLPEVIPYLVDRIDRIQNILGRQLVLENISSYHNYKEEIPESEFWRELLNSSGCGMLLDINNVYVNAHNHGFDAAKYIQDIPTESIVYYHIAGHAEYDEFKVDTHGTPVLNDVLDLAKTTLKIHGRKPIILERDNNVPPLNELCLELKHITHFLQNNEIG